MSHRLTGLIQSLLVENLDDGSFVTNSTNVLVENDSNLIIITPILHNLIRDISGLSKRRNLFSNLVESQNHFIGFHSRQLSFGFVTQDGDRSGFSDHGVSNGFRDGRVDTTTKPSVRGDGDVEDLGVGLGSSFGLGEDFYGRPVTKIRDQQVYII